MYMDHVPKIIWTYWPDDKVPHEVMMCIYTWRRKNPHHECIVLTDANASNYVDASVLEHQHALVHPSYKSLFIQIAVLSKYGGVWMYPTTLCKRPVEEICGHNTFIAFKVDAETHNNTLPVIDTHFIACHASNAFIREWAHELFDVSATFPNLTTYVVSILQRTPHHMSPLMMSSSLVAKCSALSVLKDDPALSSCMFLLSAKLDVWKRSYILTHHDDRENVELLMKHCIQCSFIFLKPVEFIYAYQFGLLPSLIKMQCWRHTSSEEICVL